VIARKGKRRQLCGRKAAPDTITPLFHADPAKAFVVAYIGRLVADGHANWDVLDNGDVRVRFRTGEAFLLKETVITRLAYSHGRAD